MKKNMGAIDKIIRLLIAAVLVILIITGVFTGIIAIISGIIIAAMLITTLIGFCFLYTIFGCSTHKLDQEKK